MSSVVFVDFGQFGGAENESEIRFSVITNFRKILGKSEIPNFLGGRVHKKLYKKYIFQDKRFFSLGISTIHTKQSLHQKLTLGCYV